MTPETKARLVLEIDAQYRAALHQVVRATALSEAEQLEVAGAVVAMLVRKMYQQQGVAWLEAVLKMVLQD